MVLSRRWATSELHVVDEAGHGAGDAFGAASSTRSAASC
jgi:hypothetical protein